MNATTFLPIVIVLLLTIAALGCSLAALWGRVKTMHDNLVEAGKIDQQVLDRVRENIRGVNQRLIHLADKLHLQYEVTPEQGRWKSTEQLTTAGVAQGYCADGSGDRARPRPEWRDHIEKVHQEVASRHANLYECLDQVRRAGDINWEAMHERVNELGGKIEAVEARLPKPRIRVGPKNRRARS